MAVDEPKVIDFITKDKRGEIVLTISDHLEWVETQQHLAKLQEKINSYLAFLESGEIYEKYPDSKGRQIRIEIVFQHRPNSEGYKFLSRVRPIIENAGFAFRFDVFAATPFKN